MREGFRGGEPDALRVEGGRGMPAASEGQKGPGLGGLLGQLPHHSALRCVNSRNSHRGSASLRRRQRAAEDPEVKLASNV